MDVKKRLHAYAQLVRLPNVFTALADISLGALVVRALPAHWLAFLLTGLASASLYSGGMVWNDFFDLEQDRRERPFRPIPSGRIRRREAGAVGAGLLAAGLVLAALAGLGRENGWYGVPLLLALLLVIAILLYDGWLKRTWAGPLGMGACRFLNVLLGLSIGEHAWPLWDFHLALVVGLYIVGVTWFARTEARESSQAALRGAAAVMLASLILALPLPAYDPQAVLPGGATLFPYLLLLLGFFVGIPLARALARPTPLYVQTAVKRSIMGLVVLDAVLATGLAGLLGLSILILLLPALYLGRWIYST
jgi:4-hydroxybenzoate polyprenyltransferase